MTFERELQAALQLSRQAGELSLDFQRKGVAAEEKPDDSPVTPADKAAEKLIAGGIEQAFPEDGLLGEEGAEKPARNGRKWIIDPIDGTRDFLRGNRFWASLIGFEAEGEVQVGVAAFPALGEVYYAVRGHGAWRALDGHAPQRIHCSSIGEMRRAVICYNGMNHVTKRPHAGKVLPLLSRCWAVRSIGGAIDAMLVCSGAAELWVEPSAKPWDLAPLQILAHESGALHFDFAGQDTIYGGSAVICTPAFQAEARAFLGLP